MNQLALSVFLAALNIQQSANGFSFTFPTTSYSTVTRRQVENKNIGFDVHKTLNGKKNMQLFAGKKAEEEEEDGEYEYEYEYVEVDEEEEDGEYEYEEYEEEEGEEEYANEEIEEIPEIPLAEDPEDELYNTQLREIQATVARRKALSDIQDQLDGPTSASFYEENIEKMIDEQFDDAGLQEKDLSKFLKKLDITEDEVSIELSEEDETLTASQMKEKMLEDLGVDTNAFPDNDDPIYEQTKINNQDLVRLQNALKELTGTINGFQDGSLIDNKQAMIRPHYELERLDRQTVDEINLIMNGTATDVNGVEYGESIKNEDPLRWLIYDLDFDVENLILASCKHNPESPLILNHWMPQLCAYSRYAHCRENEFNFSWEDCENADMDELLRYFNGLGYDEIPTFTPKETNIVELATEYDQEDITMAAFENWMDEVYVEEGEDLYFDDEDFQPENNVFDFNYGLEDSDNLVTFKSELEEFKNEHQNETQAFKNKYVRESNYTYYKDDAGAEQFRGHLVIACSGSDQDLALAEKITHRMSEEFDKQLYVETRVYSHARQEDNVYEIWLESYDIELLHSRRGAFYNSKQWFGPADVDDEQLDNIVNRITYLIGDDSRYSYNLHEFINEV